MATEDEDAGAISDAPSADSAEKSSDGVGEDAMELEEEAASSNEGSAGADDGDSDDDNDGEEDDDSSEDSDDDDEEDDASSSEAEEDSDDDDDEPDDGLSSYERLRLKRIARNKARLASLGFSEDAPKKEKKKVQQRPRKSLDGPRRQLPGRAKRATFNESEKLALMRRQRSMDEEKNPDACYTCQKETDEGELRACDYCRLLYHPDCHDPPISLTAEEFKCSLCEASGRKRRVACGKCDGCTREDDCMTCAACVKVYSGKAKWAKCIWRKCQNWGKATLIRANTGDDTNDGEEEEEEDHHDADCHVCKEGGDLICCDGCTKVYHAGCHKPKIHDLPEGEWFCMECQKSKREPKEKKKKYTGPLVADLGHKDIVCTVRFPRIECIVCEEHEVTGAYKPLDWVSCKACDDSYHLSCLNPPLESRPNSWRCPTCKERKVRVKAAKEEKEQKPLFEGEHDDDCYMCCNGGDLLCCDFCSKAYHLQCHLPPLHEIPSGLWKCQECAALEYTRKMKCGECEACKRDDCGTCANCLDKPKFGGMNRLKQACMKKKCPFMRFAPPAKATPKSLSKKKIKMQFEEGLSTTKKRKRESADNLGGHPASVEKPTSDPGSEMSKKRGRPSKRLKGDPSSGGVAEMGQPLEGQHLEAKMKRKKEKKEASAIARIINGKPLKNDPAGNKMRLIIIKALKRPEESKVQDKGLELLRCMVTSADDASKVILLGGLMMASKAMKQHFDKSIVQAEACALLSELAWVNPSCIPVIVDEGCLGLVLSAMRYHSSHSKVQQMGCGFFRALSYDFANHDIIHRVNGVGSISDVMATNAKKFDILKEGCYFLQNVFCNPDITEETIDWVVSKGTIPIIVDAMMGAPPEDAEIIDAACGALANLAINETARTHIGSYKSSITTLLSLLQRPGTSADACKCSLNALKLLAIGNEETKAKMTDLGGIKALMAFVMSSTDDDVINTGLKLLEELAKENAVNTQRFLSEGGSDFVLAEIGKYPSSPSIQACCIGILRNLPNPDADQANSIARLVLNAMTTHKEDKSVQFEGCHTMLQLCSSFPTIAESLKSKAVFPLSSDVWPSRRTRSRSAKPQPVEQPSDGPEERLALAPMNDAALNGTAGKDFSREIEAILKNRPPKEDAIGCKIRKIIVKAIKEADNSKTQDKALEHLRYMTTSAGNASKIVSLGGLTMVSKAMADHPTKTIVQAEASALLAELSWVDPSCVPAIATAGCLRQVLDSMQRHGSHKKVQQMGTGFFRAMSYDFANHEHINAVDGVRAIVDAMNRNVKQYHILKEGCYFMQNILCNPDILPETIQMVASGDTVPMIVDGISEKPEDAEIIDAACGVLANLALDPNAKDCIVQYDPSLPTLLAVLGSGADVDACKCSLNALKLLAMGNAEIKVNIADLGGIKTAMDFLSPPNDAVLLDSGLGFLVELTRGNEANAQRLLDAGGLELVMEEMENHTDSSHIQARSCGILGNLPVGPDEAQECASVILAAMKTHAEDGMVQYEGCHALLQQCCRNPIVVQSLLSEDAASVLRQSQFM